MSPFVVFLGDRLIGRRRREIGGVVVVVVLERGKRRKRTERRKSDSQTGRVLYAVARQPMTWVDGLLR